ncbi:MAG: ATP-binding protein [Sphaerochaetaceae bacterium]|nr:ATP-binding protein [Sphaerochaetaceae bacterium]
MRRTFYNKLIQWKKKDNRKPLVVKGARQVGKTWIIKEFGKNEYKSFVYINCDSNKPVSELFEQDFDMIRIIRGLAAISNIAIEPESTLIFLDEVQEIPRAVQSLKYFNEDAGNYHIIVAGSLLGIHEHKGISFPVGKIDSLTMYPMTFSEFVLASRGEQMYKLLMTESMDNLIAFHSVFVELLRQYYFTGGMPAVVQAFIDGKSPSEVREIQKQIVSDYNDDISKHASASEVIRIDQVWSSIPGQLAKENRKFVYANVQKGARAKEYETAIQWLCNSGLVIKVNRCTKGSIPLKYYEDFSAFKLYVLDCGLLGTISEAPASQILIGNNIFKEYKGSFSENYVIQQLVNILDLSIFYFSTNESKMELDFIFQSDDKIVPVEVKAEENLRAKSLKLFCLENNLKGIRFSMLPYKEQERVVNIPLYAVERLNDLGNLL